MYVPAWQGVAPLNLLGAGAPHALPFPLESPGCRLLYLARNGIYYAARALMPSPGTVALAPDYHNGLEIQALRLAGASVRFYRIDGALRPDLDAIREGLAQGARLVLVIHFNGWPQPIEEIRSLCREHGAALIEDCALAFLSARDGAPLGSFGDASVFCLYKTLPLPHGAALAMGSGGAERLAAIPLRNPGALSTAARTADLAIARIRSRAGAVGGALARVKSWVGRALTAAKVERSPVGSMTFDERQLDLGMSPWAERLLPRFDYEEVRGRRRANFERLLGALRDRSTPLFTELPDGVCPLFFPLLVENKGEAARALAARGVEAVEFWNRGDPEAEGDRFAEAMRLRRQVLELPIHQDLTPKHIDHVAGAVLALRLGVERA